MASNRRRWTRFGTRSLLLVVSLVAVWCGFHANRAFMRRRALSLVAELGGATWAHRPVKIATSRPGPVLTLWTERYREFVSQIFGDVGPIAAIDLSGVSVSERELEQLRPLKELEWISITGAQVNDSSSRHLSNFNNLRWLDVSGSSISITGIENCSNLRSLEWLNVANSRVMESDIGRIEPMFPNARIGFTSQPRLAATNSEESVQMSRAAATQPLWFALRATPYSGSALKDYLTAVQQEDEVRFRRWYISAVYRARRKDMEPLLVIQIYDGTRGVGFNFGCLLVFGPNGVLLRSIRQERIHWSLGGPTGQFDWSESQSARLRAEHEAALNKEIGNLVDLNGDGFDEIPTQRWNDLIGNLRVDGESTSIYTTATKDIPCVFCIAFPNRRSALVDLAGIHPALAYRNLQSGELLLQTPCYSATPTGTSLLKKLPQRVLAVFAWSDDAQTFLGPTEGPPDSWVVIQRTIAANSTADNPLAPVARQEKHLNDLSKGDFEFEEVAKSLRIGATSAEVRQRLGGKTTLFTGDKDGNMVACLPIYRRSKWYFAYLLLREDTGETVGSDIPSRRIEIYRLPVPPRDYAAQTAAGIRAAARTEGEDAWRAGFVEDVFELLRGETNQRLGIEPEPISIVGPKITKL